MTLSRSFVLAAVLVTAVVGGGGVAWAGGSPHGSPGPVAHASATPSDATAPAASNYVPIRQCEAVNTEFTPSGLAANTTHDFTFVGDLTAQGGHPDCSVPSNATAVQVVLVASDNSIEPSTVASLSAWPPNTDWPGTEVLAVPSSASVSSAATLQLYQGSVRVEPFGFSSNLEIDINGYYAPPTGPEFLTGSINYDGSVQTGPHITKSVLIESSQYQVTFDRDIRSCTFTLTADQGFITFGGPEFYNPDGGSTYNTLLVEWTIFDSPNLPFVQTGFNVTGICP
ncbi:MAG TPA: hypothetical protein VGN81_30660 [Pseudonocardiaceae bacterium]|jgi:hypothetical protein